MKVIVCLSGASGFIYGLSIIKALRDLGHDVISVISKNAYVVAKYECVCVDKILNLLRSMGVELYDADDLESPLTSSSYLMDAVVIAPCSLKTLSDIANSRQDNLISRVACNALRIRRKVILLVRETPLSTLDLINMLKASIAGAVVMPASPAFYSGDESVEDLINFIVGKVLDVLGVPHNLYRRWSPKAIRGTPLCARLFCLEGSSPSH